MQAAFQTYTDNAVSKTVNFKNDASIEDVEIVYRLAYKLKCKGVTIYRDGSRKDQVLSVKTEETETADTAEQKLQELAKAGLPTAPRERPLVTFGRTEKIVTGCGNLYVTVNSDLHGPCEVFTQMGKSGGCASSQSEAISRLISLSLRSGISLRQVIKHLRGIRCHAPSWQDGGMITSCADAIGLVLERYVRWNEREPATDGVPMAAAAAEAEVSSTPTLKINAQSDSFEEAFYGACPDCGASSMVHESGCATCSVCGYSRCS